MNPNFTLRTGKYAGKTIEWLEQNQPNYLAWVKENCPKMLKGAKEKPKPEPQKEVKFRDSPISAIQPNMDFDKEGPDKRSLAYLEKNNDKNLES